MIPDYDDAAPDASSMIESLRAHGYTLSTAIADIVDNSIAAHAENVWLKFDWNSGSPWISITDDGTGMTEKELVNAMKLGSKNPLAERAASDLGRFGLGLKTASFSQARRLTVVSHKNSKSSLRRWDLDYLSQPDVDGWRLLRTPHPDTGSKINDVSDRGLSSGTSVVLERLDRLHPDSQNQDAEDHWVSEVARVRGHMEMVFHRFLADKSKSGLNIFLNDTPVEPWDPFCTSELATQKRADDYDESLGSRITVIGYVLPHRDKFDPEDRVNSQKLHQKAGGPSGWNAQQGFYVYRNRRLIIPGDWLGLGPGQNGWRKEEHYKLARIRLDIPNSMDHEWQIDVKKSTAVAPPAIRGWLTGHAKQVRETAKDVYSTRGERQPRKSSGSAQYDRPWLTKKRPDGTFSYQIDRKQPLFEALLKNIPPEKKHHLETLLRLIEETVPVQRIWIDTADYQDGVMEPFETESDTNLKRHIELCFNALIANGFSENQAWEELSVFPAFQTKNARAVLAQLQE
jgi:hypothetical protein